MSRKHLADRRPGSPLPWVVAAAFLAVAGGCTDGGRDGGTAAAGGSGYSVLLISIDTLRADRLGVYGAERPTSPTIDGLAREGVVFERAFSHSPKTATSHMSLFTGLLPEAHGVRNWRGDQGTPLPSGIPTLAGVLQAAGYRTEAYTGGANVAGALGFDRGFDVYLSGGRGPRGIFREATRALERLGAAARQKQEPFLLFVHTYAVHDPYLPPGEYRAMFADPDYHGGIIDSRQELERAVGQDWKQQHDAFWASADLSSAQDRQHLLDLYDAGIRYTDDLVAKLLTAVRRARLEESTIVVFLSDHGDEFFEHGGVLHETVYREVMHVPLIFRLPADLLGGPEKRRIVETVGLIDVAPTLLELLGLPVPDLMQGRSLVPLMQGREDEPRLVVGQYLGRRIDALTAGRWKYLIRRNGRQEELFNLQADEAEQENLIEQHRAEADDLRSALEGLLAASRGLRTAGESDTAELEEEVRRQLEALGYLGGGAGAQTGGRSESSEED